MSRVDQDKKNREKAYSKTIKRDSKLKLKQQEKDLAKLKRQKTYQDRTGFSTRQKKEEKQDQEWEDIDEHERDVFDKEGYFDVMGDEGQISANDEKLLSKLTKKTDQKEGGVNLADLIMQKMEDGDFEDGDADQFDK